MTTLLELVTNRLSESSWCVVDEADIKALFGPEYKMTPEGLTELAESLADDTGLCVSVETCGDAESAEVIDICLIVAKDITSYTAGRDEYIREFEAATGTQVETDLLMRMSDVQDISKTVKEHLAKEVSGLLVLEHFSFEELLYLTAHLVKQGICAIPLSLDHDGDENVPSIIFGRTKPLAQVGADAIVKEGIGRIIAPN